MKRLLVLCLAVLALLIWITPTYAAEGGKRASGKKAALKGKVVKRAEKNKEGKKEEKTEEKKETEKK